MMLRQAGRKTRRRGMTIVETALVLIIFCMLMIGVFEYGRFLYVLHVTTNATRDGARYAVVNLGKPPSFSNTDYTDASGNVYPNIQKYTRSLMGGADQQLGGATGCQIAVYAVDPVGLNLTPPVIRPVSANPPTYPNPFNSSDPNAVPWNQAAFTQNVGVSIQGTYSPMMPGLLFMSSSIPVYVTGMACSEG
jgi:Flp pilus assembly protein TadG